MRCSNGVSVVRPRPMIYSSFLPIQESVCVDNFGVVSRHFCRCDERLDGILDNAELYSLANIIRTDPSLLKEVSIPSISPSSDSIDDGMLDSIINSSLNNNYNNE